MTGKIVYYYFSLASPWSFMGEPRLMELCARTGARIASFPIATFKDNGWIPLWEKPKNRQDYVKAEMRRWSKKLAIPMVIDDRPALANLAEALPMVYAAQVQGLDPLPLALALQSAYWIDCADVAGDRDTRIAVATAAGYDGADLAALEETPEVAAQREKMFDAAKAAGVFGSPTFVYRGELFWGQDRLDFLADALEAAETA